MGRTWKVEEERHSPNGLPTIQQLWSRVNELHAAYLELSADVKEVTQRMTTYEDTLKETARTLKNNTEILQDIKNVSAFTRKAIKIGAWPAGIIAAGFISQFGVYLYHLWFH